MSDETAPDLARTLYKMKPDDPDEQTRDIMLMASKSRLVLLESEAGKPKPEPAPYDSSEASLRKFVNLVFLKNVEAPYIGRKYTVTELLWSEKKQKFSVRCVGGGGPDIEVERDCEEFLRLYHPETAPQPEVKKAEAKKPAKTPWNNANAPANKG